MTLIKKIPLQTEPETELEALKDSAATQRALDYYLKPSVTKRSPEHKAFTVRNGLSREETSTHALELLECVIASAHDCAESLQGAHLKRTVGMLHFLGMIKALLESMVEKPTLPTR